MFQGLVHTIPLSYTIVRSGYEMLSYRHDSNTFDSLTKAVIRPDDSSELIGYTKTNTSTR